MAFSLKERVDAFLVEWEARDLLLRASEEFSEEAIDNHREEIKHRYHITEEDINKYKE